jgi:CTP synthase
MTKIIFVTGGVLSSLGKGIAAASLGALLEARGFKIRLRKFEPYINVDPGTMSPFQHGEVYVTEDGAETDLDLGHYERFTSLYTRKSDAVSTGQIYSYVIAKERRGDYLGGTVQVIPHITDTIKEFLTKDIEPDIDFLICEIGGTVGDIEGLPFLEAIRQYSNDVGRQNVMFIHLTLVPYVRSAGEIKTKPSQHSVKDLQSMGIQPDILVCRTERPIPEDARHKLALFCNVKPECVIEALDVDTIYQVPLSYSQQGLDSQVLKHFGLDTQKTPNLKPWQDIVDRVHNPKGEVHIAIVGKYTGLKDAYKSLDEALNHAGIAHALKVNLHWINAETLTSNDLIDKALSTMHGILVPGGYGERGLPGKISAIRYARENKIPYLGICLGMQVAIIEAARNLLGLKDASSTEFGATPHPVVGLMTEWVKEGKRETRTKEGDMGGTMRLGSYNCAIKPGSLALKVYGKELISERHRHRYEVNPNYQQQLESVGVVFSGMTEDGSLPEMIEMKDHPWFLAVQFHPEFKSRPLTAHPLFKAFIGATFEYERKENQS